MTLLISALSFRVAGLSGSSGVVVARVAALDGMRWIGEMALERISLTLLLILGRLSWDYCRLRFTCKREYCTDALRGVNT
jgi:hypothetical protein